LLQESVERGANPNAWARYSQVVQHQVGKCNSHEVQPVVRFLTIKFFANNLISLRDEGINHYFFEYKFEKSLLSEFG
jgi:hypothetical protein